jgi:hypothetical protein
MFKIEKNLKRLESIASSLDLVADSLNQELYAKKRELQQLEQLNLEHSGIGILDERVNRTNDDIKFLEAQVDLLQSCIILARK